MKTIIRLALTAFASLLIFSALAPVPVRAVVPNPVLIFMGQEPATVRGSNIIRYNYAVFNFVDFPNDLFAPTDALPPCGQNKNSSRSWVTLFDQAGKQLNSFCALGNHDNLNGVWFSKPAGEVPPSWIYIEINDRQTSTKYKSNLAETTM